jgi:hypothetical protein
MVGLCGTIRDDQMKEELYGFETYIWVLAFEQFLN